MRFQRTPSMPLSSTPVLVLCCVSVLACSFHASADEVICATQSRWVSVSSGGGSYVYAAVNVYSSSLGWHVHLYGSYDNGQTWHYVNGFYSAAGDIWFPCLAVAPVGSGGTHFHISYWRDGSVMCGTLSNGEWTWATVHVGNVPCEPPQICVDDDFYWFVYVVYPWEYNSGDWDIRFARSIDKGDSFDEIDLTPGVDFSKYRWPDVAYGRDGWVYVSYWDEESGKVFVKRNPAWGTPGDWLVAQDIVGNWASPWRYPSIAASHVYDHVICAAEYVIDSGDYDIAFWYTRNSESTTPLWDDNWVGSELDYERFPCVCEEVESGDFELTYMRGSNPTYGFAYSAMIDDYTCDPRGTSQVGHYYCTYPALESNYIASGQDMHTAALAYARVVGSQYAYSVACPSPVEGSFYAIALEGPQVLLRWTLAEPSSVRGLNIYRSTSEQGPFQRVNDQELPSSSPGSFIDCSVWPGTTFWYNLRAVDLAGIEESVGTLCPSVTTGGTLSLQLAHPSPNPATTEARLSFTIPHDPGKVELAVYDVAGRLIRKLEVDGLAPGAHELAWDCRDDEGRAVASGVYLVRLVHQGEQATRTLTVLH